VTARARAGEREGHNGAVRNAGGTGAPYGAVLRHREFRALLVADGLSTVGDQVARIAVALLVLERSGSAFAASATYACSYLTWLLGGPFLTAVADRYPRRRVMVVCDLLRMLLVASLALPWTPLWVVFAVLVLVGLLAPPFEAARSSLFADLLTGEHYVVGNALTNAVSQAGQLLGFVAGGALVVVLGVDGALLSDAATFGVSALLLLGRVRERSYRLEERDSGATRWREAVAGFALLRRTPRLRVLLCWGLLSAMAIIAPEGLAVAVAEEDGRGPFLAGVLTASVPAGFLLGSWLVLRLPAERREPLFPLMVTASCLPLMLTAVVEDAVVLCGLWVLAGIGNALQLVANSAFVQAVPGHLRGRAFGVASTLLMAVQGLLLLVAGAMAEVTGPRLPVAALAGLTLLLVPLLVRAAQESAPVASVTAGEGA
jgi:MFS family permease